MHGDGGQRVGRDWQPEGGRRLKATFIDEESLSSSEVLDRVGELGSGNIGAVTYS